MKRTIGIFLAALVACLYVMAGDSVAVSATVSVSVSGFYADGSSVDGMMELGYAPTETQNAVVRINDEMLINSADAGTWPWLAPTAGVYTVSHTVGDEVLSATYVVTNGYAKGERLPNPPMEVVEGITLSATSISVAATAKTEVVTVWSDDAAWTAEVSDNWLSLNCSTGVGTADLVVSVSENVAAESRVGYVYVAGQTVTVTQAGRVSSVGRTSVTAGVEGVEKTITVTTEDETTTWEAWSDCQWISISPRQGTGSCEVVLRMAPWSDSTPREGAVTIAGKTIMVTQKPGSSLAPDESEEDGGAVLFTTASTFNGYLSDEDETPFGTIQAKVAKAKTDRKTGAMSSSVTVAILIAGEKKISLRGTLDVESGAIALKAKDGRLLDLRFGANGMRGTFGDFVIDGARDVFSSKAVDDKTRANAALAKWQGAFAIVSDTGAFSVMISSRGKTRITGTLADGTKIATTAQMILGETCSCIPVVVSKKMLKLAFCIWLFDDDETVDVFGLGDDVVCGHSGVLADGAAFCIDAAALCELLDDDTFAAYLPDGVSVAQKGTKWIVADGARAGKVVLGKDGEVDEAKTGANPSALRLSYKAKDGSFTGSFKAYVLYRGKPKAMTVTVRGVVVDGIGYGTATIRKVGAVPIRIQ